MVKARASSIYAPSGNRSKSFLAAFSHDNGRVFIMSMLSLLTTKIKASAWLSR
jgi:hypothetical protein